jgi:hypothetical protein
MAPSSPTEVAVVPVPEAAPHALFLGARMGGALPFAGDLTRAVGAGYSLGGEIGFRFYRGFFAGARFDHAMESAASADTSPSPTARAATTNVDATFGVRT